MHISLVSNSTGRIFWRGGGEEIKKSETCKKILKGKERGNENEEEQKKEKKVNYKFPSTYQLKNKTGYFPGREFSSLNYLWCANFLP